MKPLTNATLQVRVKGLDHENVERIDFLFKASDDRYSKTIAKKSYSEGSTDVIYAGDNTYSLHFEPKETDKFPNGSTAWLDIRPVLKNGNVVPVKILNFDITPTLFTRGDIDDS